MDLWPHVTLKAKEPSSIMGQPQGWKPHAGDGRTKSDKDHLSPEVQLCEKDQPINTPTKPKGPHHSQTLLSIRKCIALPDIIHSYIYSFVIPIWRCNTQMKKALHRCKKDVCSFFFFHLICIVTCWLVSWFASFPLKNQVQPAVMSVEAPHWSLYTSEGSCSTGRMNERAVGSKEPGACTSPFCCFLAASDPCLSNKSKILAS